MSPAERISRFRALHASGCFVMPNPWDMGSARYLRAQGFPALASTSAGFAFAQSLFRGFADNGASASLNAFFRDDLKDRGA
jgi:2-methylisocitrate lyase-like PEP mutase family enzyme